MILDCDRDSDAQVDAVSVARTPGVQTWVSSSRTRVPASTVSSPRVAGGAAGRGIRIGDGGAALGTRGAGAGRGSASDLRGIRAGPSVDEYALDFAALTDDLPRNRQ